ncbi:MAG: hypothetical protein ABII93_00820 [Chrysiogenia bacterium]
MKVNKKTHPRSLAFRKKGEAKEEKIPDPSLRKRKGMGMSLSSKRGIMFALIINQGNY